MKPPKQPVCKTPETFPEVITNRPGLDRLRYRAGDFENVREWLFERLDRETKLAGWTYRGVDDPGIALYEGAALLLDSLTVYQEAYANEAFLRTATWSESVADLVRLLGYRLKPGIGGTGTVAFEVKGTAPVTVPNGHTVRATLAPDPQQITFQTAEPLVAQPHLSRLSLVRPQLPRQITAGTTKLLVAAGTPLTFAKNDRIAIGVPRGAALEPYEIVVVDKVEAWHGRTLLTLRGPITKITTNPISLTAVKLDRTFHIAGHNSPASYIEPGNPNTPVNVDFNFALGSRILNLDPQVPDLALGTRLAVQIGMFENGAIGSLAWRTHLELATVTDATQLTIQSGPMAVPTTVVTLASGLGNELTPSITPSIRGLIVDTIAGAPFTVGSVWSDVAVATPWLFWWGATKAADLKGRRIGIAPVGKPSFEATVVNVIATPFPDLAIVVLDHHVDLADFVDGNKTVVYGNLVDVTQGGAERDTVIGSGDDRAAFQSFQLPKGPLTYLERPALTPPERPEVEILVGDRIWTYVPVLYGQAPDAEVYIVRQDQAGNSWVQFGDGKTGARLPAGRDNVVARWRTGSGAYGALADGATPSADRLAQLGDVALVGVVAGGSVPEDASTAKIAAPARVQSLDRIVSITDVEAEALAIGGVARARAAWTVVDGLPCVQVTLLMQAGRTAELDDARRILATANRLRGPQRFPIVVVPGAFEYVYLGISIAIDASFDPEPVRDAVRAAIDALFADHTFGDAEYATRIEGVAQNVAGVKWAQVDALGSFGVADDPATLAYPTLPSRTETVPCATTHVLRLDRAHLRIGTVTP